MIGVVLDTNILVSALLNPQGLPAQVFLMTITDPGMQLCVSADIFAEYEEVIRRPRFRRSDSEVVTTLHTIREKGFWVKPPRNVHICSDPDDDMFLECALTAGADYLVTGNSEDFPAYLSGTQIVTARQFLNMVA